MKSPWAQRKSVWRVVRHDSAGPGLPPCPGYNRNMTHDEAFLRDVSAHPDDDAPRLICADWLQDHGDPARAEFIRTQIERANASTDAVRRAALWERERQLLGEHEMRWTAPLHGLVQRARFVRGFVEQVFVLGDDFLRHAEALFQLAPVRHLVLTGSPSAWAQLLAIPQLRPLSTFELRGGAALGAEEVNLLAGCPHLPHLRRLILRYAVDDEAVRVLAAAPLCSRLTALDLYSVYLEKEGAEALVSSRHLDGLSYLALGNFEDLDIAQTLTAPAARLAGLTQLYLGWTHIDNEGARRLAEAPKFARLQVLDLMGNRIETAGARALAESPHLQALQALYLHGNPLNGRARTILRQRFGDRVLLGG